MSGSDLKPITLYDIPCKEGVAWSPNVWKIRYALNIKALPFKTSWTEYPDIEATVKSLGGPPTGKRPSSGKDLYTLPTIYDPNTDSVVTDSFAIAKYLDKTYPDNGKSLMRGLPSLNAAFEQSNITLTWLPKARLCGEITGFKLNKRSEEFWWPARADEVGADLSEWCAHGEEDISKMWVDLEKAFSKLATLYDEDQILHGGDEPVFADCMMASWISWIRWTYGGVESEEWKNMTKWDGGRWARLMEAMKEYEGDYRVTEQ